MFLEKETFSTVIKSTPLVSIDLVVVNENEEALLGLRLNRPAQGYWFVPGGRIQKNEKLEDAFKRLTKEELGKEYSMEQACLLGPYTHLYDDYVFGEEFGTHYVAIAYVLEVKTDELKLPLGDQHNSYRWVNKAALLQDNSVHLHTKWYFQ
ncbi:GDP-mannose mannosyl hydrolase [Vibrio hannami]|uniref:GDP-mannose mannosyl hydrolase n=1 Tax=Vibrio hannami TaxID=2717094 RepID=UPI00240EF02C|nr:GDP-mannose mannosyl hydrolase [Vibrio hannami]MDG3088249.1 GDP-mannose mannosyl hydrolase [Vibrio hannami]